ncbi:MAG TPA: LamG-like jellyroll fold domain-containing protein [Tepidisphaeraceae bacterium]|jgi:hypothetical protein|nr:LamG-like jellyroll fold domain-containing protein [Tepidisphaeraceae bacterium]
MASTFIGAGKHHWQRCASAAFRAGNWRQNKFALLIEALEPRRLLSTNVLTWHNDAGRTGLNSTELSLTPANVNTSTFGKLFSYPVTGQVYAQPLYVSNLAIPGQGTHDVIIVATENNDVYALDADSNSGASGGVLWHVNLGLAAATPNNYFANRYGPYHDIDPQVGITSTPVIDLASGTIYVDAFTNDVAGQDSYSHHIHALSLTTGADKVAPMLVSASVLGNGVGGNGTSVPFVATQELQRPALTLLNGTLYVAYSGYADTDPYHGWILGFNPSNLQLTSVLNTTPNTLPGSNNPGEGGIWQTGAGLASDGSNLFLLVGNGDFSTSLGDYGDSMLKVVPDSSTAANPNITGYGLKVGDYFTPYNQQALADADADLGSGGGIVLPDQPGAHPHLFLGAGKQGIIYVVNRDAMGGFNASTNNDLQEVNLGHGSFSTGAYFNSSIYFHATGDVLKRYTLSNGVLSAAPAAQGAFTYGSNGATPSISSNGNANGIVWDLQNDSTHQVLRAYDATTLTELYDSNQDAARDQMGPGVKFIVPTIADGHVFAGADGAVNVYGLVSPPTTAPAAPTALAATALGASSIKLTWVDNSDNESGFKIERAVGNGPFTQIDIASANATSYTDTTVAASTFYTYQIRATNIIGDSAYSNTASAVTAASTGPVDLYHFDAGSGTIAVDSVGTNNGTLTGSPLPAWVSPGETGAAALSFSGDGTFNQSASQSVVTLSTDLSPILGATSSLDAWIKTTQAGNNTHYQAPAITGVEQAGAGNDINWGTPNAAGDIGIYVGDAGGVYSTAPINDGKWHNVAMTRDSVSGLVQLYVDGVLQGSGTFDTGAKTSKINVIGALLDVQSDGVTRTGDNYFNGNIDEVRIYNQVITANDVDALAEIPAAPTLTGAAAMSGPVVHLTFTVPSSFTQSIEIDRKTGSGAYAPLVTVGGGVTIYDDTTVTAGTQYTYIVKAIDTAGTSPASNAISVTPPVPTVVDAFTFYNDSVFDNDNGTSNITDRSAIATDKTPLMPGQTATFANYTSYSRGLNGILVDVSNLSNLPRFEDFSFAVGNSSNTANWTTAPVPELVNDYPGRGTGGSTQITVIWDDNAIQDEWLQVTLLANAHTGLASNYTFYFGNAIGETGNSTTNAQVTTADDLGARNNKTGLSSAAITNVYDFNRDGHVDTADELIARSNHSGLSPLQLISIPAASQVKLAAAKTTALPPVYRVSPLLLASPSPAEPTPAATRSSPAAVVASNTTPLATIATPSQIPGNTKPRQTVIGKPSVPPARAPATAKPVVSKVQPILAPLLVHTLSPAAR